MAIFCKEKRVLGGYDHERSMIGWENSHDDDMKLKEEEVEGNYVISAFLISQQSVSERERNVIKIKRDSIFMAFLRSLLSLSPPFTFI